LKARFARPRRFYENLKQPHLPKMRTIGAPRRKLARLQRRTNGDRQRVTDRHAAYRVRQRAVHHATDDSPFNPPFTILREWRAAPARIARFCGRKYRRPACLSVRLSGV
jgi:hypothetical protein